MALAIGGPQDLQALFAVADHAPQLGLHQRVPDRRVVFVGEALGLRDGLCHHTAQLRIGLRSIG